jgi:hypothetical protein
MKIVTQCSTENLLHVTNLGLFELYCQANRPDQLDARKGSP